MFSLKKRRFCVVRAWNCANLPGKNMSHVAAYTLLKYIIVSDLVQFLVKLWFTRKIICWSEAKILRTLLLIERCVDDRKWFFMFTHIFETYLSSIFLASSLEVKQPWDTSEGLHNRLHEYFQLPSWVDEVVQTKKALSYIIPICLQVKELKLLSSYSFPF